MESSCSLSQLLLPILFSSKSTLEQWGDPPSSGQAATATLRSKARRRRRTWCHYNYIAVTVATSISSVSQQNQAAEVKHHPDTPLLVPSLGQFLLCIGLSPPCRPGLTMSDGKEASFCCSHLRTKYPFLFAVIQIQVLLQVPWLKTPV